MRRSVTVPSSRPVHVPDSAGESAARSAARRRAFTLMELLIVIAVIAILIGIALAVGARVAGSGREDKTRYTIKALDQSLDAFISATNGIPPPTVRDPRNPSGTAVLPVADAYTSSGTGGILNSVGLYEAQCRTYPEVAAIFKSMDTRFLKELDQDGNGTDPTDAFPVLRTMFDAWDRPMRYVHPQFHGRIDDGSGGAVDVETIVGNLPSGISWAPSAPFEVRRVSRKTTPDPDADGGICRAGRPYFYSAGADGKVGYLVNSSDVVIEDYNADNVYVTKPEFQTN